MTIDLFTLEDVLMPCWGSLERGVPEGHCAVRLLSQISQTAATSAASGGSARLTALGVFLAGLGIARLSFDYSVTYMAAQIRHSRQVNIYCMEFQHTLPDFQRRSSTF